MNDMHIDEFNRKVCVWLGRGGIAAVGCSSTWADIMGGEYYCGNLGQSCRTFYPSRGGDGVLETLE